MSDIDPIDPKLAFTVATVWREERISCPHQDILASWHAGALPAGAAEFVEFHLRESQCPYCNAVVEDLVEAEDQARTADRTSQRDKLLRSTMTALRQSRA